MTDIVSLHGLQVSRLLFDFVAHEASSGSGVSADNFWQGFANLVKDLAPKNSELLRRRDELQSLIDAWHREHPGPDYDTARYAGYLEKIGYLRAPCGDFTVSTEGVDAEIGSIAGPQLVVPLDNARFALNAVNARWGSLYDALYGTDALSRGVLPQPRGYNLARGQAVIAYVRAFLDECFPLSRGSHGDATDYSIDTGTLRVTQKNGECSGLRDAHAFLGYQGKLHAPTCILLIHHGLHVELHIDRAHPIGKIDAAGLSDVWLESAVTTIVDCEDSVAAVDAEDKVAIYRNWLGLMKGTLEAQLQKGGQTVTRRLNDDRKYSTPEGEEKFVSGRSLILIRHVGHLLMTDAVTIDGAPIPETFLDAALTTLIASYDRHGTPVFRNSRHGSIYVVKPKMHGPEEVEFACELFSRVENLLRLPVNTLKMGIMDEERRTTVNLAQCIRAAGDRIVFINTGFLDRTGDEIHTSTEAGPVVRKNEIKKTRWLDAYERQNVDVGIRCGLRGRAQIGKGMWAMPDRMADMLGSKIDHPRAGASTSWVPSPTAATLHALHYHRVDVNSVQDSLALQACDRLKDILTAPLLDPATLKATDIEEELDNNVQGILGYVVRWIDRGIGCSKVLDIYGTALMEDRATLRISSQHVANWLHHGVCTRKQVESALQRMAHVVDAQNASDPDYQPMTSDFTNNIAFNTARDLVFRGRDQPNGYTELILHSRRRERKQQYSTALRKVINI